MTANGRGGKIHRAHFLYRPVKNPGTGGATYDPPRCSRREELHKLEMHARVGGKTNVPGYTGISERERKTHEWPRNDTRDELAGL